MRAREATPEVSTAAFNAVYDRTIRNGKFFEAPKYYDQFRDRYLNTLRWVTRVLPSQGRVLDVGSGQIAVLCRHLLGCTADVLDIDTRSAQALAANGVGFHALDLAKDSFVAEQLYDLVVLAEVIEHVPIPPYVVFSNLVPAIKPGGHLLITTPNLYRLRNLVRLASGRKVFDYFLVPGPDQPLGHFIEYSREQLEWHVKRAGLELVESALEQLTWGAGSVGAKLARQAVAPLLWARPLWRDNLVILARRPS
jgi:2-polyprenyl-3-methyl-5-hydroxy-6-metoxy-1,4-benzoquinol methylase